MNQFQFDLICKIIETGAPALANELIGAMRGLAEDYNRLAEENAQLKAQVTVEETSEDSAN